MQRRIALITGTTHGIGARGRPTCCTPLRWRARLAGSRITANCLHPGIVATNLLPRWLRPVQRMRSRVIFDATRGARTTLHLALADEVALTSGRYFDEHQRIQQASPLANDAALQETLWTMSERWTGLAAPAAQQNA